MFNTHTFINHGEMILKTHLHECGCSNAFLWDFQSMPMKHSKQSNLQHYWNNWENST